LSYSHRDKSIIATTEATTQKNTALSMTMSGE